MLAAPIQVLPASAALLAASAASAALGLGAEGVPAWLAAGACASWAVGAWPRFGLPGLVAALPACALLPGGGWGALAGWTLAGLAGMVALQRRGEPDETRLRRLRAELRDAEHERSLLHRHIQRYPVLLDACLELSAAREGGQFAEVLCRRARALLPDVREVLVFLGEPAHLECQASSGVDGKACARAAGDDELYVAAEARPLVRRSGRIVRLLIPLRGDRRQGLGGGRDGGQAQHGALVVELESRDVGDRLALELLGALGRLGGLGLAAVDLVSQARGLALRDDLTGLYGQHEFLRRLDEQAAASRRQAHPLGVIMCDLDHLKRFNDTWGHPAGDAALTAVAKALVASVPTGSIACRYGGEEFAVTVPGLGLEALTAAAERVRRAIAGAVVDSAAPERRVTASLGVAVLGGDEGARAALARADAACYRAKAAGRDRVETAS